MSKQAKKYPLTEEQKATAIELASKGASLSQIIGAIVMTEYQFLVARGQDPIFEQSFHAARQEGLEHIADELIDIADNYADVHRARLKSENMRWLLSKRKPSIYGDKIDLNVNQQIDISAALKEARNRIQPGLTRDVSEIGVNDTDALLTANNEEKE